MKFLKTELAALTFTFSLIPAKSFFRCSTYDSCKPKYDSNAEYKYTTNDALMIEQSAYLSKYVYKLNNIWERPDINVAHKDFTFRDLIGFDLNRNNWNAHVFGMTGIMTDHYGNDIGFVSFRGTSNIQDFFDDANLGITNDRYTGFEERAKVYVHELNKRILQMKKKGISEILFTGHSLGGADATIAPVVLGEYYPSLARSMKFHVITFGSPRPGNNDFAKKFRKSVVFHRRITNGGDAVTNLPTMAHGFGLFNFIHVDDGVLIWNIVNWWNYTINYGLTYCKIYNYSQTCGHSSVWYTVNVARSVEEARQEGWSSPHSLNEYIRRLQCTFKPDKYNCKNE